MVRTNHVKVNKEAIREKVSNKNISLSAMSKIIGRSDAFLPQLVRPNSSGITHILKIQKLADALGCTIDELVEQYDDATGDKNLVYIVDKLKDDGLADTEIAKRLGYKNTIALRKEYNKGKHILYIERKRVDDGLKHVDLTSEDLEDDDDISNVKEKVCNHMGVPMKIVDELDKEYRKSRREAGAKLDMTVWDLLSFYDTSFPTQVAIMLARDESIYYKEFIPEDILDSYVENWRVLTNFNVLGVTVDVPPGCLLLKIALKEDK